MFDDGTHRLALAHDAAIAGGVGHVHGEQGQALARTGLHQGLQGGGLDQGHITIEHQADAVLGQQGQGLLHRVARAQLGRLQHGVAGGQARALRVAAGGGINLLGAMAGDHDQSARPQPCG